MSYFIYGLHMKPLLTTYSVNAEGSTGCEPMKLAHREIHLIYRWWINSHNSMYYRTIYFPCMNSSNTHQPSTFYIVGNRPWFPTREVCSNQFTLANPENIEFCKLHFFKVETKQQVSFCRIHVFKVEIISVETSYKMNVLMGKWTPNKRFSS